MRAKTGLHARATMAIPRGRNYPNRRAWELAGDAVLSAHAGTIVGWPEPEAKALLMDLTETATQREFVYAHKWRVGDLLMWDNRQTMHRARPFPYGEARDVRRTTPMGDAPTTAQVAA